MTAPNINPTTGNDVLSVGTDATSFLQVPASAGDDTIDLENNRDAYVLLDYSSASSIDVDLTTNTIRSYSDPGRTTLADTDTLINRPDDYLGTGGGGLAIEGTSGNDNFVGAAPAANPGGTDYYYFEVLPGLGNDTIVGAAIPANGVGTGTLRDGEIFFSNRVDWRSVGGDVTVSMAGGGDGTATYTVGGTTYTDTLDNINQFRTGLGNDSLLGDGLSNQFRPEGGNDSIDGGGGNDEVRYTGSTSGVNANLETGVVASDGFGGTDQLTSIEDLRGAGLNDTLVGSGVANVLRGEGGNDGLSGAGGNDTLIGGSGSDTLSGGAGADSLLGGAGSDTLVGGSGNDTFTGSAAELAGDTIADFAVGDSIVVTGANLSGLNGANPDGTVDLGGGQTLTLTGITSASGTLAASFADGNTTITLSTAASVATTAGNDVLSVGTDATSFLQVPASAGDDTIDLENNRDAYVLLDYSSASSIDVDLTTNTIRSYSDPGRTALADTDTLINRPDDYLGTGGGGLAIEGTSGHDNFVGAAPAANPGGTDYYYFEVLPGLGNDTIVGAAIPANGVGTGTLRDGEIFFSNRVDWRSVGGDVTVSMAGGGDGTATYTVGGTTYTDTLDNINQFRTGLGNDSLLGDGLSNQFRPEGGNDSIDGGGGNDEVRYTGSTSGVNANLETGVVASDGFGGTDQLTSIEDLRGAGLNDTLVGSGVANVLRGEGGNDGLSGAGGNDTLIGGSGSDTLSGGAGADSLLGGAGSDTLAGGSGNDVFTGSAAELAGDTIADFAVGDSIVVTGASLSGLNGTATGTVDLGGGQTLTLTGIGSSSGTFTASVSGGNTTITLVAPSSGDGGGGGSSGGGDSTPTTPPAVTTTAPPSTPTSVGSNSTVTPPPGVNVSASTVSTGQAPGTAGTQAINQINSLVSDPVANASIQSAVNTFTGTRVAGTTLDVVVLSPTGTGAGAGAPIVLSGTAGAGSGSEEVVILDLTSFNTSGGNAFVQLDNIEFASVIGNATITGGAGSNYVVGDGGSQSILLGDDDDTLMGGSGDDTVGSAGGDDVISGGEGVDRVFGGEAQDAVYGNQGADVVYGNQGLDTLFGGQDGDTLFGGQHQDVVYGNLGDDVLYGNLGGDTLFGGQGSDVLYGGMSEGSAFDGTAVDVLHGNLGDDTLFGGLGDDLLYGGDGADLVVIGQASGNDTVADFDGASSDRVQIAANANGTSIDTFAELQASAADNADGNVEIALGGGNVLTLIGVNTAELQADWFLFA